MANEPGKLTECFVLMPISDTDGYEKSHFSRVYTHIIQPACSLAGLKAVRADDVFKTNYIIVDILRRIIESEIVICDLSARNPNVLYELGIRQAFNKPVVLIKDTKTERIFDIQGLRYTEYDYALRVDLVQKNIEEIAKNVKDTMSPKPGDINSLIQLLSIKPAAIGNPLDISAESKLILDAIAQIGTRMNKIENIKTGDLTTSGSEPKVQKFMINGEEFSIGDMLHFGSTDAFQLLSVTEDGIVVKTPKNLKRIVTKNHPDYQKISYLPF